MSDYTKNITYLSAQQYETLKTNGSITVDGTTVTYNQNDLYVTPQVEPVTDVRINGSTITSSGVANIPIATASSGNYGVTRVSSDNGVGEANGALYIVKASDSQIITGTNNYRPIVSGTQHKAVFYGLAKAAGVTSNVSTPTDSFTAYTAAAKGAIQKMLGVTDLFGNEENDVTANRAYAIGEAFVSNGKLYRATAAIAQDGAIVTDGSGVNCEQISIAEDFVKKTDLPLIAGTGANSAKMRDYSANSPNVASGINSFAIGLNATASGIGSYAEGIGTVSSGQYSSHAEGQSTLARGIASHAEGKGTKAYGHAAHAEGYYTIAGANYQHAGGTYNSESNYPGWVANTEYNVGDKVIKIPDGPFICIEDNTDSEFVPAHWQQIIFNADALFTIGNGIDEDHRSNALRADWDGTLRLAGNVYVNCASDSTGGNKLISEVDYATSSTAGVVKTSQSYGTTMTSGALTIAPASNDNIKGGTNAYKPIVPAKQNQAVFYGLAKVAGVDLASETVTLGTYPATASAAIRSMIGAIGNADYATSSTAGIVKAQTEYGIEMNANNYLSIARASNDMIKQGTNATRPITPNNQHRAVFYGLAKVAGDTTQSSSNNEIGTYTAEAKGAIRAMLDVDDSIVEEYINSTSPSITAGPNCRYICGEVTSVSFTPCASGSCELMFTSGSSVAVLTLPSTVKMPEWFEVETNTIYDIIITNGVYGAVMSWPL